MGFNNDDAMVELGLGVSVGREVLAREGEPNK